MNSWLPVVLLSVGLGSAPVLAGPDSVGLGSGRDGPLVVTEAAQVINQYAQVTGPAAPGDDVLLVADTTAFSAGELVLVLQATGLVPEPPPGSLKPLSLPNDSVGQWEFARLARVGEGMLTLSEPLVHAYAAEVTQVIRVPEYTQVQVQKGASLRAVPWNGRTGGVLAFLSTGILHNEGEISATGAGFQGGSHVPDLFSTMSCKELAVASRPGAQKGEGVAMTQFGPTKTGRESVSNGGGGGVCPLAGGGGGGSGGPGGRGGGAIGLGEDSLELGGQGGSKLVYSLPTSLGFGGGGGGGHGSDWSVSRGGAGGGIVVARAQALTGAGSITADGEVGDAASTGGAGGGGAGGGISLRFTGTAECGVVSARGGDGGAGGTHFTEHGGAGGGGGGGRVLFLADAHARCPLLVDAGLADAAMTSAGLHANQGAQPSIGARAAHAGLISESLGSGPVLGQCLGENFKIEVPANGARVNAKNGLTVRGVAKSGINDVEVVFGEIFLDPPVKTSVVNGEWKLALSAPPKEDGSLGVFQEKEYVISAVSTKNQCRSEAVKFTVDWTAPDITLDVNHASTPKNPSNLENAVFVFSSSEQNDTVDFKEFRCSLGVGSNVWTFEPCISGTPYPINKKVEGTYTFKVKAVDHAANSSEKTYVWRADFTPPTAKIDSAPAERTNVETFAFAFSSNDNDVKKYQCALDDSSDTSFSDCKSGDARPFPLGTHTYYVRAVDDAGNTGVVFASHTWTVDKTPPNIDLDSSANPRNPTNSNTARFRFSSSDDYLEGFQCALNRLDEQAFSTCTSEQVHSFAEGPQTFYVRAVDKAGNKSAPLHYSWQVDLTPPDFSVDRAPGLKSTRSEAKFEFSSTAPDLAEFQCAKENSSELSFAHCSSPMVFDVSDGTHKFYVRAVDKAGNKRTPYGYEWRVDTTAPTIQFTEPLPDELLNTNLPFFRGASEPESSVRVFAVVGSGEVELGLTSSDSFGRWYFITTQDKALAFAEGAHTVVAKAVDSFGNVGVVDARRSFIVDTVPPKTEIIDRPAQVHRSYKSDFAFSSSESGAEFECQIDGGERFACTDKTSLTLGNGVHTLAVRAKDKAGNVEINPATYVWSVHVDQPLYPDISEPANGAKVDTGTPTISGRAIPNVEVVIIIDGQRSEKTALSDADGRWSFQPTERLAPGRHTLSGEIKSVTGSSGESRSPEIFFTVVIASELSEAIGGGIGLACNASGSMGPVSCFWGLFALVVFRRKYRS